VLQVGTGSTHWNSLERVSYVRLKGRWVAYPFQNNIAALETDDQIACLKGLIAATVRHATSPNPPGDFDEWILRTQARILPSPSLANNATRLGSPASFSCLELTRRAGRGHR
jgi:hypothetical protein